MKPLIYVYVDHPMCSYDCADATCEVLNKSNLYNAQLIGPDSFPYVHFCKKNISKAKCLVFPGGEGDADQFDKHLTFYRRVVVNYVNNGGKYLGICQGSYFASKHYFNLLSGYVARQYIKTNKPSTRRCGPAIVDIKWQDDTDRTIYFHDGAAFIPESKVKEETKILGIYKNDTIASLIQRHKKGAVGVIGPHPEAMRWWFYCQRIIRSGWTNELQHDILLDIMKNLLK